MRTLAEVLQRLPTTPENGLAPADVLTSRQCFGANRLTPLPREPLWKKFLAKFDEPIIKILLAAALLSMIVDQFRPSGGDLDTLRYTLGGVVLGLSILSLSAAYVLQQQQWIPTLLFLSALILWPIGL